MEDTLSLLRDCPSTEQTSVVFCKARWRTPCLSSEIAFILGYCKIWPFYSRQDKYIVSGDETCYVSLLFLSSTCFSNFIASQASQERLWVMWTRLKVGTLAVVRREECHHYLKTQSTPLPAKIASHCHRLVTTHTHTPCFKQVINAPAEAYWKIKDHLPWEVDD